MYWEKFFELNYFELWINFSQCTKYLKCRKMERYWKILIGVLIVCACACACACVCVCFISYCFSFYQFLPDSVHQGGGNNEFLPCPCNSLHPNENLHPLNLPIFHVEESNISHIGNCQITTTSYYPHIPSALFLNTIQFAIILLWKYCDWLCVFIDFE